MSEKQEVDLSEKLDIDHIMQVGILLGQLARSGFRARPLHDVDGGYTSLIEISLPDLGRGGIGPLVVRVAVLPPPKYDLDD